MRSSPLFRISLIAASILTTVFLVKLEVADTRPVFYVLPSLSAIVVVASLGRRAYATPALFLTLLTFALAMYAIVLKPRDAMFATFALPSVCWTLAALVEWHYGATTNKPDAHVKQPGREVEAAEEFVQETAPVE